MQVYRIAKTQYITDTSGMGAKLLGGRWNTEGVAILYTTLGISLAMLEVMVHIIKKPSIDEFSLAVFKITDENCTIFLQENLIENWQNNIAYTQNIGNEFVKENKRLCLKVPSAIVPNEFNILVNPKLMTAKNIVLQSCTPFVFDDRLFK